MGALVDYQIRELALQKGMIVPFAEGLDRPGIISYGLSSMGYDLRLGNQFKIFTNFNTSIVDPKNVDPKSYFEVTSDEPILVPPNSYVLGCSVERFNIPRNIVVTVLGKSTYARIGCIVNVTPGEPEWAGVWTLEIANSTTLPMRIYPNEGIAQALFFTSEPGIVCERSYADKNGKYQNQTGVTNAIVASETVTSTNTQPALPKLREVLVKNDFANPVAYLLAGNLVETLEEAQKILDRKEVSFERRTNDRRLKVLEYGLDFEVQSYFFLRDNPQTGDILRFRGRIYHITTGNR